MFNKLKKNYFLLISTFFILYFAFNLFGGDRGLFSYFKKKSILISLQNEEINLSNKIRNLDFKNSLLSDKLDLDYVEMLIRKNFYLVKKMKQFILLKNDNQTSRKS